MEEGLQIILGEIKNFIKVWVLAMISLCYSYYIAAKIPRGISRLLSLIPVFSLFFYLPMTFSFLSLCGIASIFLSWYANFKLVLFCFDHGPLFPPAPKLLHFISIASLPIKIKQFPPSKSQEKLNSFLRTISLAIKVVLSIIFVQGYNHRGQLNRHLLNTLLLLHYEFGLEFIYAVFEIPVKFFLGFELEPQFNEPLLATSLQDFWGKRWNLMSSDILRQTIYNPLRHITRRVIGHRWAFLPAVLVTFLISGLMHELIYYHITRLHPTWGPTVFFVMQGILVDVEIVMKKKKMMKWRSWQFVSMISRPLVLGFRVVTCIWLLPFFRDDMYVKASREYSIVVDFVKELLPLSSYLKD